MSLIFFPSCIYAMEEIELKTDKSFSLTRSLPQSKASASPMLKKTESPEIFEDQTCSSCESCLSSCWSWVSVVWGKLFCDKRKDNLLRLPKSLILHIAFFLRSDDVLKLSGTCRSLRNDFDESYWITFLSKTPEAFSYLVLGGPLSPVKNRKDFFAHLWYREGYIRLSARLKHPEAMILDRYGNYGAQVSRNQYVCPLNIVRYRSKEEDRINTSLLQKAMGRKLEEDRRKSEEMLQSYEFNRMPWDTGKMVSQFHFLSLAKDD